MKIRIPTIRDSLQYLELAGLKVNTVIDVGSREGTPFLCRQYPDAKHYLFEPDDSFNKTVAEVYSNIDYTLTNTLVGNLPHMSKLDDFDFEFSGHCVLKIDVDGGEMRVIRSATDTLKHVDVVIVEVVVEQFTARITLLEELGFTLFDLCNFDYSHGRFAQCDAIMLNNKLNLQKVDGYSQWENFRGTIHD